MRPLSLSALLLSSTALVTARPSPHDQPPPSGNILAYVDPAPSNPGGDTRCSALITPDGSYLAFPSARIVHQSSGTIDCQIRLTLTTASQTAGYRFSADWVSLAGYLSLEPGAYIERVNVSAGYFPAGGKADVATARNLYGKHGTGYDGRFNLSIPLVPDGSDGKLGATACRNSAGDPRTGISVTVFVSLAHEMIEFDDTAPHYGTVGGESPDSQLEVGIEGVWEKC